uniref:MARVEL domain-containing protein n=1 Tax=Enterobius vermicularis TaxID=51028 RepID=A0A0N4VQ54_ENTVE
LGIVHQNFSYVLKFLIIVLKYFINFFQLLGLIVWRSVSSGCWYKPEEEPPFCMFNRSETTCSATSAIGFFSLATAIALLIMDAQFDKISAVQTRKRIVVLDMAVSGFLITFTFSSITDFAPPYQTEFTTGDQQNYGYGQPGPEGGTG